MTPHLMHRTALRAVNSAANALLLALACTAATAAPVTFDTDPFSGSTALATPGRQIFTGNQRSLPSFDVASDQFVFDAAVFGLSNPLRFLSALAADIPAAGGDVIVLRDSDNDGDPATPFNAGTAANLIASRVAVDGGGFFVYFNSALSVDRLVFSTNLNDPSADLSVLARIDSPTGQGAINALPTFTSANFASTVPEPSTAWLLGASLFSVVAIGRRRRGAAP